MADTAPTVPAPPLLMVPATAMGVQPINAPDGSPMVIVQLSNAVATANFPMTLEQAAEHVENVKAAIAQANGLELPPRGLVRP